ncbi:hypothetical protein BHYA_0004g00780 [Botrytis hyacinthi]|uniref:Secreted protein n=1 Tax=Botrytis hyacinthi TaxID=278943 RepID=A0A4Z1H669_9HELO|nr:hypothetical protein BHYA_0004g00780 [Botrytis hyacinthi]
MTFAILFVVHLFSLALALAPAPAPAPAPALHPFSLSSSTIVGGHDNCATRENENGVRGKRRRRKYQKLLKGRVATCQQDD